VLEKKEMGRRNLALAVVAAGAWATFLSPAWSQQDEKEPAWARNRPQTDAAMALAPVAAQPVPTPRDELPALEVPEGFKVAVLADGVLDARSLRQRAGGTVFVSSNRVGRKIYALTGAPGKITVKTVISGRTASRSMLGRSTSPRPRR
jgi:hypothetical protein